MSSPHPAYDALASLLGERTGLSFTNGRREGAELGIRRAMARAGVAEPERYRDLIACDGKALDDLIVELTVGETYFFREPAQFALIRATVLPELRQRLGGDFWVRAWSAGCASGEEAYSLAILFDEEGFGERTFLLATDVSRTALAKARQAMFGAWSLRGENTAAARRYLHGQNNRLVLEEKIRRRVHFEYLNLALDVYPSFASGAWGMNLILCRNVLIYFDRETVRAVARRLYDSLAPGGWLFTASSDPPLAADAPFEIVTTDVGMFYRRGDNKSSFHRPVAASFQLADPTVCSGIRQVGNLPPQVSSAISDTPDPLTEAQNAFARGDYALAVEYTRNLTTNATACVLHVRALSNLDTALAVRACAEAAERHPLSTELHYLHAVLLLSHCRDDEALRALRRVLYLDRSLASAHFTLAVTLERRGDQLGARRAYRNAFDLAGAQPADERVPLSDGERAGRLAETAAQHLATLEAASEEKQ